MLEYIQNNPNQIIAIAAILALIFTFISILITAISVSLQRKHNKQSVRPIASIEFANYEDKISVSIKNTGLGPLIIEDFYVLKDNKIINNNLVDCMPTTPELLLWKDFSMEFSGMSLTVSEEISALELTGDIIDPIFCRFRDEVRKSLAPLKVRVVYKNIYD